jgi:hypothetical protein
VQGWYLFWLGLAVGVSILAVSAYVAVSPRWLRVLLYVAGGLTASRYVAMALLTIDANPTPLWLWKRLWFASSFGLTLPSLVALDQLIRHPAMSPRKLMMGFTPFLLVYGAVLLFGRFELKPDPVRGISPSVVGWGLGALALAQGVFVIGFLALGAILVRAVRSPRIRLALLGLMLAQGYLGLDGLLVRLGRGYPWPFLFSEILTLVALWFALDTAQRHAV